MPQSPIFILSRQLHNPKKTTVPTIPHTSKQVTEFHNTVHCHARTVSRQTETVVRQWQQWVYSKICLNELKKHMVSQDRKSIIIVIIIALLRVWNGGLLTLNSYSASHDNWCTATLWNRIMTVQCEGMGEVGSARYEPALLPPCPSIRALSYSNCQRSTHSNIQAWQCKC